MSMLNLFRVVLILAALLLDSVPSHSSDPRESDSLLTVFQTESLPDSTRVNALFTRIGPLLGSKPDTVLRYAHLAYTFGQTTRNPRTKALALRYLGRAHRTKGDLELSIRYLEQGNDLFEALRDSHELVTQLQLLGYSYGKMAQPERAIGALERSMEIARAIGHPDTAFLINEMGILYGDMHHYEAALRCFHEQLAAARAVGDKREMVIGHTNIGTINRAQGNHPEALNHYQRAYDLRTPELSNRSRATLHSNLGIAHLHLKDTTQALAFLQQSLDVSREGAYSEGITIGLAWKARCYQGMNLDSALILGEEAVRLGQQTGVLDAVQLAAEFLAETYEMAGRADEALAMYKISQEAKDSLLSEENLRLVAQHELKKSYESRSAADLPPDQNAINPDEDNGSFSMGLVWGGLALLLALALALFYRQKRSLRHLVSAPPQHLPDSPNGSLHGVSPLDVDPDRDRIESAIGSRLNDTDWSILQLLHQDSSLTNADLAGKIFMSREGVSSSLRKMYRLFDLPERGNKRLALILAAVHYSSRGSEREAIAVAD